MIKIKIDKELCKGCKLCITACPLKLINLTDELNSKGLHYVTFNDKDGKCNGCKSCAVICPDVAIKIEKG